MIHRGLQDMKECGQRHPPTHVHMSIISMPCFNKTSPTYCLYISDANLSLSVGDGYSVSLAGDASLHSNDYSEEDRPFSVTLRAQMDFFYGYGWKDYIFFTSSPICPAGQPPHHSQKRGWWRHCCNPPGFLICPTASAHRPGIVSSPQA